MTPAISQFTQSLQGNSAIYSIANHVRHPLRLLQSALAFVMQVIFNMTRNGFAMVGAGVVVFTFGLWSQPTLIESAEATLREWLITRNDARAGMTIEADATDRATATDPRELPTQQAAIAYWLSKKYRVAPEPISALVAEAYEAGQAAQLDPTLILAIMAIESSFNPFAQSSVGAQGLMQVMTSVHTDKYDHFGGRFAAFDPVTNLRVGVKVLQDCIARADSIEGGLKHYVGATGPDDGGYAAKVLAEQQRLILVSKGKPVPTITPITMPTVKQLSAPITVAHRSKVRGKPSPVRVANKPSTAPRPSKGMMLAQNIHLQQDR